MTPGEWLIAGVVAAAVIALCLALNRRGRDKWTTDKERSDPPT